MAWSFEVLVTVLYDQAQQLRLLISGGILCVLCHGHMMGIFQSLSSDLYHLELLLITA